VQGGVDLDQCRRVLLQSLESGEAARREPLHTYTVGLIVQAKEREPLPAARRLFERLFAQGSRASAGMITEALAQAGED